MTNLLPPTKRKKRKRKKKVGLVLVDPVFLFPFPTGGSDTLRVIAGDLLFSLFLFFFGLDIFSTPLSHYEERRRGGEGGRGAEDELRQAEAPS